MYMWNTTNTVKTVERSWKVRSGIVKKKVHLVITPNVVVSLYVKILMNPEYVAKFNTKINMIICHLCK